MRQRLRRHESTIMLDKLAPAAEETARETAEGRLNAPAAAKPLH